MLHTPRFFSSKCNFFHNAKLFGSCIIHILYTGSCIIHILYTECAEIKKNNSGAKGLISLFKCLTFFKNFTTADCKANKYILGKEGPYKSQKRIWMNKMTVFWDEASCRKGGTDVSIKLHGVTSLKTGFLIFAAARISNLILISVNDGCR